MFTTIQNIKGRIGNQMFEVANAYAYSKRYNRDIVLNMPQERDTYYKKYEWITGHFNCFDTTEIFGLYSPYYIYNEPIDGSYKPIENINNNLFCDGYFQDKRYFEDYSDDIKKLFKINFCVIWTLISEFRIIFIYDLNKIT